MENELNYLAQKIMDLGEDYDHEKDVVKKDDLFIELQTLTTIKSYIQHKEWGR